MIAPGAVSDVWLITGIPGAGKSTVARGLAAALPAAAHIEGDALADLIVSGRVLPGEEPAVESDRQIALCIRNQCLLARSLAAAGFVPIIDYVIINRARIEEYREQLPGLTPHFVMLAPGQAMALARDRARAEKTVAAPWAFLEEIMRRELTEIGLWIDNSQQTPAETVEEIVARQAEAGIQGRASLRH